MEQLPLSPWFDRQPSLPPVLQRCTEPKRRDLLVAWWASVRQTGPAWGAGSRGAAAWQEADAVAWWGAGEEAGWSGGAVVGTQPCWLWRQSLAFGYSAWVLCSWGGLGAWRRGEDSFLVVGDSENLGTELSGPGWALGTRTASSWPAGVAEMSSHPQDHCSSAEGTKESSVRRQVSERDATPRMFVNFLTDFHENQHPWLFLCLLSKDPSIAIFNVTYTTPSF